MPDRSRYYLTTAIAYANSRPGLHTLYEVIAADVISAALSQKRISRTTMCCSPILSEEPYDAAAGSRPSRDSYSSSVRAAIASHE